MNNNFKDNNYGFDLNSRNFNKSTNNSNTLGNQSQLINNNQNQLINNNQNQLINNNQNQLINSTNQNQLINSIINQTQLLNNNNHIQSLNSNSQNQLINNINIQNQLINSANIQNQLMNNANNQSQLISNNQNVDTNVANLKDFLVRILRIGSQLQSGGSSDTPNPINNFVTLLMQGKLSVEDFLNSITKLTNIQFTVDNINFIKSTLPYFCQEFESNNTNSLDGSMKPNKPLINNDFDNSNSQNMGLSSIKSNNSQNNIINNNNNQSNMSINNNNQNNTTINSNNNNTNSGSNNVNVNISSQLQSIVNSLAQNSTQILTNPNFTNLLMQKNGGQILNMLVQKHPPILTSLAQINPQLLLNLLINNPQNLIATNSYVQSFIAEKPMLVVSLVSKNAQMLNLPLVKSLIQQNPQLLVNLLKSNIQLLSTNQFIRTVLQQNLTNPIVVTDTVLQNAIAQFTATSNNTPVQAGGINNGSLNNSSMQSNSSNVNSMNSSSLNSSNIQVNSMNSYGNSSINGPFSQTQLSRMGGTDPNNNSTNLSNSLSNNSDSKIAMTSQLTPNKSYNPMMAINSNTSQNLPSFPGVHSQEYSDNRSNMNKATGQIHDIGAQRENNEIKQLQQLTNRETTEMKMQQLVNSGTLTSQNLDEIKKVIMMKQHQNQQFQQQITLNNTGENNMNSLTSLNSVVGSNDTRLPVSTTNILINQQQNNNKRLGYSSEPQTPSKNNIVNIPNNNSNFSNTNTQSGGISTNNLSGNIEGISLDIKRSNTFQPTLTNFMKPTDLPSNSNSSSLFMGIRADNSQKFNNQNAINNNSLGTSFRSINNQNNNTNNSNSNNSAFSINQLQEKSPTTNPPPLLAPNSVMKGPAKMNQYQAIQSEPQQAKIAPQSVSTNLSSYVTSQSNNFPSKSQTTLPPPLLASNMSINMNQNMNINNTGSTENNNQNALLNRKRKLDQNNQALLTKNSSLKILEDIKLNSESKSVVDGLNETNKISTGNSQVVPFSANNKDLVSNSDVFSQRNSEKKIKLFSGKTQQLLSSDGDMMNCGEQAFFDTEKMSRFVLAYAQNNLKHSIKESDLMPYVTLLSHAIEIRMRTILTQATQQAALRCCHSSSSSSTGSGLSNSSNQNYLRKLDESADKLSFYEDITLVDLERIKKAQNDRIISYAKTKSKGGNFTSEEIKIRENALEFIKNQELMLQASAANKAALAAIGNRRKKGPTNGLTGPTEEDGQNRNGPSGISSFSLFNQDSSDKNSWVKFNKTNSLTFKNRVILLTDIQNILLDDIRTKYSIHLQESLIND